MSIPSIPSPPDFDIDHEATQQALRQAEIRQRLDPSDVLAVTQHILLEIVNDTQHPLWPLVKHCTAVGTASETGQVPYMAELVGEALLPLIDRAISRLVGERLDDWSAWEA